MTGYWAARPWMRRARGRADRPRERRQGTMGRHPRPKDPKGGPKVTVATLLQGRGRASG